MIPQLDRRHAAAMALLIVMAFWMTLTASSAFAAGAPELTIAEVDVRSHPQVSLVVTVPASLVGTDVTDHFTVVDGDREVPVTAEPVSTEGLEVVLAVDTSGSMQGAPMDAARAAAKTFVGTLPAGTQVAVIGFGASPRVVLPFSSSRDAQVAAIDSLSASGETALHDALVAAGAQFANRASGRRAIVLLSDGGDTVSTASLEDAIGGVRDIAPVSIVELVSPESDHASLARIAKDTRGRLVAAADSSALDDAYRTVSADLVGRYRLTYRTERGGETKVAVSVRSGDETIATTSMLRYPDVAVAPTADVAKSHRVAEPGLFGSSVAVTLGGILVFAALSILGMTWIAPRRQAVRLVTGSGGSRVAGRPGIAELTARAGLAAERSLERRGKKRGLDTLLEQAGVALRAGEVVVIGLAATGAAFALGFLLGGPIVALVFGALPPAILRTMLALRRDRRRKQFGDQLGDLLQLLAGSLRAGYGLMQALESASTETEAPMADELRRLTTEVRLGRDVNDALDAMAERLANEDFEWVTQAIRINREIGGDLSEVLDRVAETIRARNHVRRQVAALSAEGRMSAFVLFLLPIGLAGIMTITNRAYIGLLFSRSIGFVMIGIAVALLTAGGLWLKALVRPVY